MPGPFRLLPGPAGDLWTYATTTPAGSPSNRAGHVLLCHDLPLARASAHDVALTYPALADRLSRETGWRVVTGTLRGAGDAGGDFSAQGWIEDLGLIAETEIPADAPRLVVGFGFGGVLALHLASLDERVAGVACLGTPATLNALIEAPDALIERCLRSGVISTPGYPGSVETWAKELSILHPTEDAALMKGRPLLVVHGSADGDIPSEDANELAAAATGPTDQRIVVGAGHWLRADPRVIAILIGWLERRR
jgi:putative redox protein